MSYRKHPTKGNNWWYIVVSQGSSKRQLNFTYYGTEDEVMIEDKRLNALIKGERLQVEPTIADALISYTTYYKTRATPEVVKDMLSVMKRCLLPHFGKLTPRQIVSPLVYRYISERLETKVKNTERTLTHRSVERELNYLSAMVKWMKKEGLADKIHDIPRPSKDKCAPKKETIPVTIEEFAKICSYIDSDKIVIFMLMGYLGLRITEAATIRIENIDLQRLRVHVLCKGGKFKIKPISHKAIHLITALKEAIGERTSGHLVVNKDTQQPYKSFKRTINTAAKMFGIGQRVTHHNFRHALAVSLEEEDTPDSVHMAIMGHSTVMANKHYRHATSTRALEYADKVAAKMDAAFDKVFKKAEKMIEDLEGATETASVTLELKTDLKRPSYLRLVK